VEPLSPEEIRVLGALVEKERTVPDSYPLTLNGLTTACNQTTNRDPVVSYEAAEVQATLDVLREKKLTRIVYSPSNRAPKFRHVLDEAWDVDDESLAVLAVLLLRGPQTLNELRTRTERYEPGVDDVEGAATPRRARRSHGRRPRAGAGPAGGPVDAPRRRAGLPR
jgi:uncharacterized protein